MGENISSTKDLFIWLETLSEDECKDFFRKEIVKLLGVCDYDIKYILDEVKTSCEYVTIFFSLNNSVSLGWDHKPTTYGYQKSDVEQKIQNAKKRIIKDLKFLYRESTLDYDGGLIAELNTKMENIKIDEHYYEINHKETIKNWTKKDLILSLHEDCKTGKRRANRIVKILDFL